MYNVWLVIRTNIQIYGWSFSFFVNQTTVLVCVTNYSILHWAWSGYFPTFISHITEAESTDVDKVPLLCMHWQAYNLSGQWFCCLSQKWKSAGCTINWNKTRVVGVSNLPAGLSVFTPAYFRVRFYPILRALIMYFLYFSSWKTLQDLSENYILQFKILLKILLNI